MIREGGYRPNLENLHDPELKEGDFSAAHEKMQSLQEDLKQVNKRLSLKRDLVNNARERLSDLSGERLKDYEKFIEENQKGIVALEKRAGELTIGIKTYFASHLASREFLKDVDEEIDIEN